MWKQAIVLIHKAQLPLTGRDVPYVNSVKEDAAGVPGKQAADGLQKYGLTRTRAAQDGEDSPFCMVREMGDSVKLPLFTEKLLITIWFIV